MSAGHSNAKVAKTGNSKFLAAVATISKISGWIAAGMIVLAVFITCQMIVIRFVLNGSTVWQTEAVIYLMVAATLLGLAYVQLLRGHVNVDLFPLILGPKLRFSLSVLTSVTSIGIVGLILIYGFEYWHFAWDRGWRSDTVWGVRLWIPYLSIPIGFGLLLLQLVADLFALIKGIDTPFGLE